MYAELRCQISALNGTGVPLLSCSWSWGATFLLFAELGRRAFVVGGAGVQHLRDDLELGAYFRALELGCRTRVPSEIGIPVPTRACDFANSEQRGRARARQSAQTGASARVRHLPTLQWPLLATQCRQSALRVALARANHM